MSQDSELADAIDIMANQIVKQNQRLAELEKTLTEHDELLNGGKNKGE